MNFGHNSVNKRASDLTSSSIRNEHKVKIIAFKVSLFVILLAFICIGLYAFGLIKGVVAKSPNLKIEDVRPVRFPSYITDKDGNKIQSLTGANANRIYVKINDITKDTQNAFIAIEDSRFYEHNGIDPQGIARAFFVGIKNGGNFTEGASTITQQLVKNSKFNFMEEKTFSDRIQRKIQEIYLSIKLEKIANKKTILEYYLNTINLGQSTLGIQKASERYFGKPAKELTLSESATIAAITQSPTKYNPIIHPENNAKRRTKVLKNMLSQGYITKKQFDEALSDNVYDRISQVNANYEQSEEGTSSYFVDTVISEVSKDLQEQLGYTKEQAYAMIYSGGLTIKSTLDPSIQNIVDEEMNNDNNYPAGTKLALEYALTVTDKDGNATNHSKEEMLKHLKNVYGDNQSLLYDSAEQAQADIDSFKTALNIPADSTITESVSLSPQPQASIVVMDQYTGIVKAIGGGRGPKSTAMSFNRAVDAKRQPGSCFKVLSTYVPAIDAKNYTLYKQIVDEPFNYDNGRPVNNWYSGYWGPVTLRYAIAQSMNVCAVKTLTEITPRLGYNYLKKLGITTLVDNWESPDGKIFSDVAQPLALGGITKGVTNLEITNAYATIANNGTYTKPRFYTKITDHDGKVIIDNKPQTRRAIKDSTAGLLIDAMQDVITQGTGGGASLGAMPVSGKTGTTTDDKDIWFCGFTPYYACSVWGGYDISHSMSNTSWHMTLWRSIMSRIHENLEPKEFKLPASVGEKTLCADTGMKPRGGCHVATGLFALGKRSNTLCNKHKGGEWDYEEYQRQLEEEENKEKEEDKEKKEEDTGGETNPSEPVDPAQPVDPVDPVAPTTTQ